MNRTIAIILAIILTGWCFYTLGQVYKWRSMNTEMTKWEQLMGMWMFFLFVFTIYLALGR